MPVNKETDIALPIMGDYQRRGFKCYSEVRFNGDVLDLVCVQGQKIECVEVKQFRSRTLMKQVIKRKRYSHNTVAATFL